MTTAVLVALVVSLIFAAVAAGLGRRLPRALATRVLVAGSLAVTGSTVFVLAVVAFTWIGQLPEVAALGPWSSTALHHDSPIPAGAAIGSALLLPVLGAQALRIIVLLEPPRRRRPASVAAPRGPRPCVHARRRSRAASRGTALRTRPSVEPSGDDHLADRNQQLTGSCPGVGSGWCRTCSFRAEADLRSSTKKN